jgi:acetate kinase
MNILVINTGSSSLKYQLFDMERQKSISGGIVERIGEPTGVFSHREQEEELIEEQPIPDHEAAMHLVAGRINTRIDAVGHRVVQGGESFKQATRITDAVKTAIRENNPLAPLHNPSNLVGIEVAEKLFPDVPQAAVFDTNFHQSIPQTAYMYALPYEFYEKYRVRKYGFHGTSHKYVAARAAELMERSPETINLITLHLGNGCSVSAIRGDRCVDTSMGMTPLAGIMMGTRTGDFDPAVLGYLMEQTGMDAARLDTVLNKASGLKGICGRNDLRDIHDLIARKDFRAALALDMFTYQIKKVIGAYTAVLGRVDSLVFTAGVGENDAVVREKALAGLDFLGVTIDPDKNRVRSKEARSLHQADSRVQVWVIPTNEELQIAIETIEIL